MHASDTSQELRFHIKNVGQNSVFKQGRKGQENTGKSLLFC